MIKTRTFAAIILATILAISSLIGMIPTANATEFDTFSYISVIPDPVGVDQTATILVWLNHVPPTAAGAQGDHWEGTIIKVTRPDGTTQNLGPFDHDIVGGLSQAFTPTQVGTYTFQMSFPGQTLTGIPGKEDHPAVGDYYKPSTSRVFELTVQEEPIVLMPTTPAPDYWERPLNAENRELWQLGSNWLMAAYDITSRSFDSGSAFAPNNKAPNSAHILWTRELTFGGLIGAENPTVAYYQGLSYETMLSLERGSGAIIINGRYYYNTPLAPKYGFYCVDLNNGETIFYKNDSTTAPYPYGNPPNEGGYFPPGVPLTFGQILDFESPNQHGGIAYLWSQRGSTWHMYDAWTGNYILAIENVPSGTIAFGPNGELMVYRLEGSNNRLIVWNSTLAIPPPWPSGSGFWQWRPDLYRGQTLNGTVGIQLNVTVPDETGSQALRQIEDDVIYAQTGDTWIGYDKETGAKLWSAELNRPQYPGGAYRSLASTLSPERVHDGVYAEFVRETMQWYGYDVQTGQLLWGPTEPYGNDWGYYAGYTGRLGAYGNLYSAGYDGVVHAYDIHTGEVLWEYSTGDAGFETPYSTWPFYGGLTIADGKIFAATGEHSPGTPLWKGEKLHVIDAITGEPLWNVSGWYQGNSIIVADGKLLALNCYDNRIYAFGKGPSATTVTTPDMAVTLGDSIMIKGTVTDQSPGAMDTPAISDESMPDWMGYIYMQKPVPADAKGVEVSLDVIDSNGNYRNIGTATTDMSGTFGLMWTPDIPGQYTVMATFAGSESYGSSYAQTYLGVVDALQPTATPDPTPAPMTDTYVVGTGIAVIAAIAVAVLLILRKK